MVTNEIEQRVATTSDEKLTFSVVMCAYTESRWDDMLAAVESVKTQTYPPFEIILVIDHNPTLLERTRAHLSNTGVIVIENAGQRGLSSARNSGIAVAQGSIIAFMDEDALAAPDWLAQLNRVYRDQDVMGAGGAIRPNWLSERPKWFPEEFDWVVGCTYRGMPEAEAPVRNLIGCNMSFRRYVTDLNGSFRDGIGRIGTLPVGCEETEYCIRANQKWPHKKMIFNPQAQVFHNVPAARANWRYFVSRCYAEGISKAVIGRFVGTSSSLSSEKTYVLKILPKAILRGLASTVFRFDLNGLGRAVAVVAGLGFTGVGYLKTRIFSSAEAPRQPINQPSRQQREEHETV